MKKTLLYIFVPLFAFSLFLAGHVYARSTFIDDMAKNTGYAGRAAGFNNAVDPRLIAANAIKLVLTFIGIILFSLNVYAGYNWMTAGGNEEKITTAKNTIRNSTIGLIIVLSAYSITIAATNLALGRDIGSNAGSGSSFEDAISKTKLNSSWFKWGVGEGSVFK